MPKAPATETLWAVDYPDGQDRELTFAEIEREMIAGAIDFGTLVWREGMDEWLEIGQVPELQGIEPPTRIVLAPTAAQLAQMAQATPPAAPVRAKAPSAPTLEPSKPDLPKPRPPAPTMSGIGLPQPPVTQPFEAPAPAPSFSAAPSFPAAPAFPAAPSFPPAPEPPVMVPAPAIAAPFATPVQPFPGAKAPPAKAPPAKAPSSRAPGPTPGVPEWPEERKNRAPLILGVVVLLVAVAGGLYAWKSSQEDKLPPPTPISALPPATPPAGHTAEPTAATAEPTPTAAPANTVAAGSSRSALDPPKGSLSGTPNAGFAEMFANGARNADEKTGGTGQRFDPNAANKALAAAAMETAKCKEAGGPTGLATVMVTFDPSGKVSSATVSDAPFAGTSSGTCIATTMKRATVPPFTGLPGTATKIISIQ